MRKLLFIVFGLLLMSASASQAPQSPTHYRWVEDEVNLLSEEQEKFFLAELQNYSRVRGNEVVLYISKPLAEQELQSFCKSVIENWSLGGSKKNGVVLLVTVDPITKDVLRFHIEATESLQGYFPQWKKDKIKAELVDPVWEKGRVAEGLNEGLQACMILANGELVFTEEENVPPIPVWALVLALAFLIYFFVLNSYGSVTLGGKQVKKNIIETGGGFDRGGSGGGFSGAEFEGNGATTSW